MWKVLDCAEWLIMGPKLFKLLCLRALCFVSAMGVAELLKWRAPPLIILVWILLCYNKSVCQNEARL